MTGQPLPADRVNHARQLRGWTKADLAREAGISRPAASRACAGLPVAASTTFAIAEALALTKKQIQPAIRELLEAAS